MAPLWKIALNRPLLLAAKRLPFTKREPSIELEEIA
jgi:hypothetical protein